MKQVQVTEVVLEDTDVARALVEFVNTRTIQNMVLGASHRLPFLKSLPPSLCFLFLSLETQIIFIFFFFCNC